MARDRTAPRNFFLNERHELKPTEKPGGGGRPNIGTMGGRPGTRREHQVQTRRKAERCQRITVPGLTSRQRDHAPESATQKSRILANDRLRFWLCWAGADPAFTVAGGGEPLDGFLGMRSLAATSSLVPRRKLGPERSRCRRCCKFRSSETTGTRHSGQVAGAWRKPRARPGKRR